MEKNFELLLNGKAPTLDEYASFLYVCEQLPSELLWKLVTEFPELHFILKTVANDQLKIKVKKENSDHFHVELLKNIAEKLRTL